VALLSTSGFAALGGIEVCSCEAKVVTITVSLDTAPTTKVLKAEVTKKDFEEASIVMELEIVKVGAMVEVESFVPKMECGERYRSGQKISVWIEGWPAYDFIIRSGTIIKGNIKYWWDDRGEQYQFKLIDVAREMK